MFFNIFLKIKVTSMLRTSQVSFIVCSGVCSRVHCLSVCLGEKKLKTTEMKLTISL